MRILACPLGEPEGNSAQYYLYEAMMEKGIEVYDYKQVNPWIFRCDIFHIHWPQNFFKGRTIFHVFRNYISFLISVLLQKLYGTKIIWTCHNIVSHQRKYLILERSFMKIFIKLLDGTTLLLETSHNYAIQYYPGLRNKPFRVIPPGHYIGQFKNDIDQATARKFLNIPADSFVFSMIGNLYEYKGIPELISSFSKTRDLKFRLLLAGKIPENKIKWLINNAQKNDRRIIVYDGFVTNEKIPLYFKCTSLTVLPFREINNSGSLYLTLSFNTPALVPNIPQMKEVKEKYGNDEIILFDGVLNSEVLENTSEIVRQNKIKTKSNLTSMNYEYIADSTINFFKDILNK